MLFDDVHYYMKVFPYLLEQNNP